MLSTFLKACKNFVNRIKDNIKKIAKPATASLTAGAVSDLLRSKSDLIVENALLLRQ